MVKKILQFSGETDYYCYCTSVSYSLLSYSFEVVFILPDHLQLTLTWSMLSPHVSLSFHPHSSGKRLS